MAMSHIAPQHQKLVVLEEHLINWNSRLNINSLLDGAVAMVNDLDHKAIRKNKNVDNFLQEFQTLCNIITSSRMRIDDFDVGKVIGQGSYGKVALVRHKTTKKVFALKRMSKYEIINGSVTASLWEERKIMLTSNSEWIVQLHYAFQDVKYLYMAMDYMPGGDLANLLSNYDFSEEWAKFYCAEVVLALDVIHSIGFVHRDVKPANMLLDKNGHLKLTDFGISIRMDKDGMVKPDIAVGTADYMSPEVLKSQEGTGYYGRECDWWAVGVVLYEMLVGDLPFYTENVQTTYGNILNHQTSLKFPDDIEMSNDAKSLIHAFLTDRTLRLGKSGIHEIMVHSFFRNNHWTWENIRETVPPMVPKLVRDDDTSYFDDDVEVERPELNFRTPNSYVGNHLPFIGFTYNKDYQFFTGPNATFQNTSPSIDCFKELQDLQLILENEQFNNKQAAENIVILQNRIDYLQLELDKSTERDRLNINEIRRLQDNNNLLEKAKRNAELELETFAKKLESEEFHIETVAKSNQDKTDILGSSEKADLEVITGKNPEDKYQDEMMSCVPGPTNFGMLLTMFGNNLDGTDTEDVIRNSFKLFENNSGYIDEEKLCDILTTEGDEKFTEDQVNEFLRCAPIHGGNFDYDEFIKILKHGNKDGTD